MNVLRVEFRCALRFFPAQNLPPLFPGQSILAIRLLGTPKSDLPLSCNGFGQSILAIPAFRPVLQTTTSSSASFAPFAQSILAIRHFSLKITQNFNVTASIASAKAVATPSVKSFLTIMSVRKTGKYSNIAPDQSLLPQTDTHPSKPVDPRQNALVLSDEPFSQSCLTKGNHAINSLKLRYTTTLLATLDLTKTCKTCFDDSILPRKSEHRHSQ